MVADVGFSYFTMIVVEVEYRGMSLCDEVRPATVQVQRDLSTVAGSEPVAPLHAAMYNTARLVATAWTATCSECFCTFLLNRTEF